MTEIDWKLTPKAAFEAQRALIHYTIFGPWELSVPEYVLRESADGAHDVCVIYDDEGFWVAESTNWDDAIEEQCRAAGKTRFETREAAMAFVDEILSKEEWVIVSD